MIDLPMDEVTVSVDEGTRKSVFIGRQLGMSIGVLGSGNKARAGHISLLGPDLTSRLTKPSRAQAS